MTRSRIRSNAFSFAARRQRSWLERLLVASTASRAFCQVGVEWRVYQLHQTHSQFQFSNSCRSTFGLLSGCTRVKKLLALLLALGLCEFVTPYPNRVWNWRRRSKSNRRIQLLQSRALPLGYS